jgi:hypothetical protein
MVPHSVSSMKNLKASKTWSVPSHMYFERPIEIVVRNDSAKRFRTIEFAPSAARTRSLSAASSSTSGAGVEKRTSTSRSAQRSCRSHRRSLRPIAAKPWPPTELISPRKWMSMSLHLANFAAIASATYRSAVSIPPRVSSENTTPKPNVSSARLRS